MLRPALPRRVLRWLLALLLLAPAAHAFAPGEVFVAPGTCFLPCQLLDVTGGGDFAAAPAFAWVDETPGQIAWDDALAHAYATQFALGEVIRVGPGGGVTTFVSGLVGPTGLLWTDDGRLLVAAFYAQTVYDVTAGGAAAPVPFATGVGQVRNLLQLASGEILAADQGGRRIIDITGGGDFTGAAGFAFGFPTGPFDLVEDAAGDLYASTFGGVFEVSAGGNVAGTTPYATGPIFAGLTVDGAGRLLASALDEEEIYDISGGGDFTSAQPFAWNVTGFADTALDTVPLPPPAECADGLDNDGDGRVDAAQDPGCEGSTQGSEQSPTLPCDDGLDNDGDGLADYQVAAGQGDPGCSAPQSLREDPQCQDGVDNDGDGTLDFDGGVSVLGQGSPDVGSPDPHCANRPWRDRERRSSCGLGFELAFVLWVLRRRRRR